MKLGTVDLETETPDRLRDRLVGVRRRLGPFTALQGSEPFRLCDAEIARCLSEVVAILDATLARLK